MVPLVMSTRTTDYHVLEENPSRPHLHNKSGQIELPLGSAAQDPFTIWRIEMHGSSDVPCTPRVSHLGESGVFGVFLV
jgi:hypothetical protein